MRAMIELMDKKQMGGKKHDGAIGNATEPRKLKTKAGNEKEKEREKLEANQEETEEAEIDDGPRISEIRPNKKRWKRQAREPRNRGVRVGLGAQKRPFGETIEQSPKKKAKFNSPTKSETKKQAYPSPTTRIKLTGELLGVEEMEVVDSNTAEISEEAGAVGNYEDTQLERSGNPRVFLALKNPSFVWFSVGFLI